MPESRASSSKLISFYDVDARAELRSVPFQSVTFCPRVGENVEVGLDLEQGGGVYLVVGVRHILEDQGAPGAKSAAITSIVVELKPEQSSDKLLAGSAEITLEELAAIPVPAEPFSA